MWDFFRYPVVWWALTALFLILFAFANIPRPSPITLPWLFFAAICAFVAYTPNGTVPRITEILLSVCWEDRTMFWHLLAALILSVPITALSLGASGFLPVLLTCFVTQPFDALNFVHQLNHAKLGDNSWPYLILSGVVYPWALPFAWGLTVHTPVSTLAAPFQATIYIGVLVGWGLSQSFVFSYLMFGRSIF